jgi:hypothetical protein
MIAVDDVWDLMLNHLREATHDGQHIPSPFFVKRTDLDARIDKLLLERAAGIEGDDDDRVAALVKSLCKEDQLALGTTEEQGMCEQHNSHGCVILFYLSTTC